jgi:hypothetical protein
MFVILQGPLLRNSKVSVILELKFSRAAICQVEGFFPSTQRYYRYFTYDDLQAEVYLLEITLTTDTTVIISTKQPTHDVN